MVIKKQLQLTEVFAVDFIQLEIELNNTIPAFAKEMISELYRQRHKFNLKIKHYENLHRL